MLLLTAYRGKLPADAVPLSRDVGHAKLGSLEAMDLDGLGIEFEAILLIDQELLNILTLITLELDHLAHLRVVDDGAIAGKLLLDDLENFLLVKLFRQTLDRGQSFTTIALLDTDVNVILRLLSLSSILVGFGEGIKGFEVFD